MTPAERIHEAHVVFFSLLFCYIAIRVICRSIEKSKDPQPKFMRSCAYIGRKLQPLVGFLTLCAFWFTPNGAIFMAYAVAFFFLVVIDLIINPY